MRLSECTRKRPAGTSAPCPGTRCSPSGSRRSPWRAATGGSRVARAPIPTSPSSATACRRSRARLISGSRARRDSDVLRDQLAVWTTYKQIGEENAGSAAALVEELGFGSFWLGGSPRLSSVRPLLEATERMGVGTSIVNIWTYEPAALASEWAD